MLFTLKVPDCGCDTRDAKITKGYALPAKYVIHTVGPVWHGDSHEEQERLTSCYKTSLKLAAKYNCESVAFPLISAGIFGYPKDKALRVAVTAISEFLMDNDMTVYIVVYGRNSLEISQKLFADINEYIDDNYVAEESFSEMLLRKIDEQGMTDAQCYRKANIDRSGSMSGFEADTIGGFNSMIEKQKQEPGEALITTILFDHEYEVLHDILA